MKYQTIEQMITDRKYETPDNYYGPEYHGYIGVISQNRDSDCLSRSNFATACDLLGYDLSRPLGDDVVMSRSGHWLCGWVNILYVSTESPEKLVIAMSLLNALDDYPVLDEDSFYELEREELDDLIERNHDDFNDEFARYLGKKSLNQAEKLFIKYNIEESSDYYGHEDAWFITSLNHMLRTVELIRDNGTCNDSIEMNKLLDQLDIALEIEKLSMNEAA